VATFHVPGVPVPKARPRVVNGHAYTPKRTQSFERAVGLAYQGPLFEGSVALELDFNLPNRRRVDLDNLVKSTMDGLTGHAYHDDGQVVKLVARKHVKPGDVGIRGVIWCADVREAV
jgi:Holliday junction resolvase RusA-like endonuclease